MKKYTVIFLLMNFILIMNTNAQSGGDSKKTDEPFKEKESKVKDVSKKVGGFFQKGLSKISKLAGSISEDVMGITATGDLSDVNVTVSVGTNIYPKNLNLLVHSYQKNDWVDNGDFTMLQLESKDGSKYYKYSGTIKANGTPVKHNAGGVHTTTEFPNPNNKKITFEKGTKMEGSLEVPMPTQNVKLISINGQKSDVKVDLTKDVVLEISNYSTEPSSLIRVDIVGNAGNIRSLYVVGYLKPADKITIPAAAFRNIETLNKGLSFKDCYLSISDHLEVPAQNTTGKIPNNLMVLVGSHDGMPIDVINSEEISHGLQFTSGNTKITKGNAAFSMPLSLAKNIAISSFYSFGENYSADAITYKVQQTGTAKTIDFPVLSDNLLNETLSTLHGNIKTTFSNLLNAKFIAPGIVRNSPVHENSVKFMSDNLGGSTTFLKVYEGLSPLKGHNSAFNRNYGENAMLKEFNADAILKVSLRLNLNWHNKSILTPYLHVELKGKCYGDYRSFYGTTTYFTMDIQGVGYELKEDSKFINPEEVFQISYLSKEFKVALEQLLAKEKTMPDYEALWKIQQ